MNLLRACARPALALPALLDGISALREPEVHVERAHVVRPLMDTVAGEAVPTDEQLTVATRVLGGVMLGAATCFALGKAPRTSATVLATISIPMALVNHPLWTARSRAERREMTSGMASRFALAGAYALASTDRVGAPSVSWRVNQWQARRALEREKALATKVSA